MLLIIFLFSLSLPTALPPLADNVPAAWRSWGVNCTQFGLSPPVKGHNRNSDYHFTPNFAKPLVRGSRFSQLAILYFVFRLSPSLKLQYYQSRKSSSFTVFFPSSHVNDLVIVVLSEKLNG